MGAGKWRQSYAEDLRGRKVVILPDNDATGRQHAEAVARSIKGIAAEVRLLELPGRPANGGDVSDWLRLGGTAEALRKLVDDTPSWAPPSDGADGSGSGNGRHQGNGQGPPGPATGQADNRPVIRITTEHHEVIAQAVAALAAADLPAEEAVFQRGNMLVRVLREPADAKKMELNRQEGTPRIAPLPAALLDAFLTKTGRWMKRSKNDDGAWDYIQAHPPRWAILGVDALGNWPGIPLLEGIIEAPTLRADGSIIDVPGWDRRTGLLYEPAIEFPPIPDRPTRKDAQAAAELVHELVSQFPFMRFDSERGLGCHFAAWLAAVETVLARYSINGTVPLFLMDGNVAGAGKSLLCNLGAIIATGRVISCSPYPEGDREEMRKVAMSVALAGDRLVMFDNIPTGHAIGGAVLDAFVTARAWTDRVLGTPNRVTLPNNTVFLASGNNLRVRGDALRRVILCRLETSLPNPEQRDDLRIKEIENYVQHERGTFVVALLTILKAHADAGRPMDPGLKPTGFPAWDRVVRAAIHWATGADPAGTREELRGYDDDRSEALALIQGLETLCMILDRTGLTSAEVLSALKTDHLHNEELEPFRDLVKGWSRSGDLPTARILGNRFGKFRRRVFEGGKCLDAVDELRTGQAVWSVRTVNRPKS
jgi:putative DNA primase/helicase